MRLGILNTTKMINAKGFKEVTSHHLSGPGSLFDPDIFGYGEMGMQKAGYIKLNGHFINGFIFDASVRLLPYLKDIVTGEKKFIITESGDLELSEDGETGLDWFYKNFNRIKIKRLENTGNNKFQTREMKKSFNNFKREEFFTDKVIVIPQYLRDIDTSSGRLKIDELNQIYIDIINAANMKKNAFKDSTFADIRIQGLVHELYQYFKGVISGGPNTKGMQREFVMGKNVKGGMRTVISAPAIRNEDVIGETKYKLDYINVPMHFVLNNFFLQTVSSTNKLLNVLYDNNIIPQSDFEDKFEFDSYYNNEYIEKIIETYGKNYTDRYKPLTTPKGTICSFYVKNKNKEYIKRPITWIDIFFIAIDSFREFGRYQSVRYPATDKGSIILSKFNVEVFSGDKMGEVYIKYDKNSSGYQYYFKDYPIIDEKLIENPDPHIFEETTKFNCLYLDGLTGDFDGDKISPKPLYSIEAAKEIDKINNSLLMLLKFDGTPNKSLGKEPIQTFYNLTESKRKFDRKDKKEIVEQADINFLTQNTVFKLKDILELFIKYAYNSTVNLNTYFGKNKVHVKTTLGKLIFNCVVLGKIKHKPFYYYVNETLSKKELNKVLKYYADEAIEAQIKLRSGEYKSNEEYNAMLENSLLVEEYKDILNKFNDIGMGLTDVVSSNLSYSMMFEDNAEFNKKKEEIFNKYRKEIDAGDIVTFEKAEKEVIAYAKELFKDDEMIDMYESGSKPAWNNDFKAIRVSIGPTPSPSGDVTLVESSLNEGIKNKDMMPVTQMQIMGAAARALATADAGYLVKKLMALLQSVKGYKGDCKTTKYWRTTRKDPKDLLYRYIMVDGKPLLVTKNNVNEYLNKEVDLRSSLFCHHKDGLCSTCLGELAFAMHQKDVINIGIDTVYIGNILLNLYMKKTHDMKKQMIDIGDLNSYLS